MVVNDIRKKAKYSEELFKLNTVFKSVNINIEYGVGSIVTVYDRSSCKFYDYTIIEVNEKTATKMQSSDKTVSIKDGIIENFYMNVRLCKRKVKLSSIKDKRKHLGKVIVVDGSSYTIHSLVGKDRYNLYPYRRPGDAIVVNFEKIKNNEIEY